MTALAVCSLLFVAANGPAANAPAAGPPPAGALSTPELLAAKDSWFDWRESGAPLRVEGRVQLVAGGTLRLRGLPLTVRPAAGATLGRADDRTSRVEITGRLAAGPTGTFLEATAVRVVPSDDAEFTERQATLDKSDPAAWDALTDWAAARAEFYEDRALARRAGLARRAAFDLRWDAAAAAESPPAGAPAGAPPGVLAELALLDAPPAASLDPRFRLTRTHDALRAWWDAARDDPAADLAALTGAIAARLPGADRPAVGDPPADGDLLANYAAAPPETYRDAPDEARRALHRAFFVTAERERIERSAAPDGRDGFAVAARLTDRLPELADLAEGYRTRELAWRLARVASATRAEAAELAALFAARGDAAKADETVARWLAAREKSLRGEGVNGLIRAAEEYRAVSRDPAAGAEAAARLLREAYAEAPPGTAAEEDVAARLTALGLTRVGDRWLDADAPGAALPAAEVAVREGRVTVGMTASQVRRALGDPPVRTVAATGLGVAEVWVYARPDAAFGAGGGLAVHLTRPRGGDPDAATVAAVHRL